MAGKNGQTTRTKEKTEEKKSSFDVLDEVQSGGGESFFNIADEAETAYEQERLESEGPDDETGLSTDKTEDTDEAENEETEETVDDEDYEEEVEDESEGESEEDESEDSDEETEDSEEETSDDIPEWLSERLKEENPDLDTSNAEDVQKAIDDLSGYKSQVEKVTQDLENERESNKAFYDLLEGSQSLREVAKYMHKHKVSHEEALSALGVEPEIDLETLKKEDPDAYIEAKEARKQREKEREEAEKKTEERKKILNKNKAKSEENADAFKKDNGLDDKDFDELIGSINPEMEYLGDGLVTKNFLSVVHKGLNYDQAVEKAREEGIKEGKNKKIDELRNQKAGDGLPHIDSGSTRNEAEKDEGDIWSEALDEKPLRVSEIE